jgi:GTPase SAR1 family protein
MPGDGAEQTWIVLGCDHAGKSTLIASLCGKVNREDMVPTCGFSKSTAALGRHRLRIFDVGGGKGIRGIWDSYYADAHGAIFVVNATEPARFEECRGLLQAAYQHAYLIGKPLLVVANKSDLPQAIGPDELANALRMHELAPGAHRVCRAAVLSDALDSAGASDGIASSLTWLASAIHDDFGRLQERCAEEAAEQGAAERKKKEERKARLAAKREAQEREEAAESARIAAGQATAAMTVEPASGGATPPSPVPSPPAGSHSPCLQASVEEGTRLESAALAAVDYFAAAVGLERATSMLSEISISPLPRRVQAASPLKDWPVGARGLPMALEVESF